MKKICFIHIPKCGGTSIRSSMKRFNVDILRSRKVSLDHLASVQAAESMGMDVLSYREGLLRYFLYSPNFKYVFGHFKCTKITRELYQDQWCFVTLIRDPLKRWYSHYYFDRYRKNNPRSINSDLEIKDYMESPEGLRNARLFTRHFTDYVIGDEISDDHVKEAVNNILQFDVYGVLENMDSFVQEYKSKTGVRLKVPVRNTNPKKNYKKLISTEIKEQVKELCRYDIEIYEQVKSTIEIE